METFLYALQDEDFDTADATLADNIVWQNVGYTTMRGRQAHHEAVPDAGRAEVGFEVKFHRIAAEGNAVLTERTDAIIIGPLRLQFWVCGVFEVHGGEITLWRDYFDTFDFFVKAPLRGARGDRRPVAAPKMRTTFRPRAAGRVRRTPAPTRSAGRWR